MHMHSHSSVHVASIVPSPLPSAMKAVASIEGAKLALKLLAEASDAIRIPVLGQIASAFLKIVTTLDEIKGHRRICDNITGRVQEKAHQIANLLTIIVNSNKNADLDDLRKELDGYRKRLEGLVDRLHHIKEQSWLDRLFHKHDIRDELQDCDSKLKEIFTDFHTHSTTMLRIESAHHKSEMAALRKSLIEILEKMHAHPPEEPGDDILDTDCDDHPSVPQKHGPPTQHSVQYAALQREFEDTLLRMLKEVQDGGGNDSSPHISPPAYAEVVSHDNCARDRHCPAHESDISQTCHLHHGDKKSTRQPAHYSHRHSRSRERSPHCHSRSRDRHSHYHSCSRGRHSRSRDRRSHSRDHHSSSHRHPSHSRDRLSHSRDRHPHQHQASHSRDRHSHSRDRHLHRHQASHSRDRHSRSRDRHPHQHQASHSRDRHSLSRDHHPHRHPSHSRGRDSHSPSRLRGRHSYSREHHSHRRPSHSRDRDSHRSSRSRGRRSHSGLGEHHFPRPSRSRDRHSHSRDRDPHRHSRSRDSHAR